MKDEHRDLLKKALTADGKIGDGLIPQSIFSGTDFFFNEKGRLCIKLRKNNNAFKKLWRKSI